MLESRQLLAANPVITEFMASNGDTLADGDANSSDWIEIHNAGDESVDLAGYRLTDDHENLARWVLPSTVLDPGAYLVVFASGQDRNDYVDPLGNLHTNFKLGADGEYVALVSPSGSIVSEFGTAGHDFPLQWRDASYGVSQATTLIGAHSRSMYWTPLDDSVDATWTAIDFDAAAHGFETGTTSLGFETRPSDRTNFADLIETPLREGVHAVYTRMEFTVDDASQVNALTMRLKYDNGFIAYLNGVQVAQDNAPPNPNWFSTASGSSPSDRQAVQFAEFNLSDHADQLVDGRNVLAIHAMNSLSDNSDMLLVTELIGNQSIRESPAGYLPVPTPGGPNFVLGAITGPLISDVTDRVGALDDNQDVVVTARVAAQNGPVASASLVYRVMFDNEVTVPMVDDGTGADATAGDGVYSAVIPHTSSAPGDMLRWRVTAEDTAGNASRAPIFLVADEDAIRQSPEYFGTVVADPSQSTDLPDFLWFTEDERGAHGRAGTRASVFYGGEFYDNIFARQRGGATNATVSQKFVFNRDQELLVNDQWGRVREFNMNGPGSDPSYLRQTMAYQAYLAAGNAGSESFLTHMRLNGEFDRVGIFIEQADEDFLARNGMDPGGALYKFVQRSNLGPVFSDTVTGIEKKTQIDEDVSERTLDNGQKVLQVAEARRQDVSDIQAIVDGLGLPTAEERKAFVFDNFNIPQLMNYLSVRSVTLEADDVRKNFYLYQDSFGTGEWSIFPWDKDWTFGVEGDGGTHLRSPFFGDEAHAKQNANQWNVLYDVIFAEPATREMFLRRLRSVMDEFLGRPGTPQGESYFEQLAESLFASASSLLPAGAASAYNSIIRERTGFFDRRRQDLYENHSIHNPDFRDNAGIPDAQMGNPTITFGDIEIDPASGNQDEEFIELKNPNASAVDISGWQLTGGATMTFKPGTVIPSGQSLYVSPNVNAFRARTTGPRGGQGLFIQGNYEGHLSRDGETIALVAADGSIVHRVSVGGVPSPVEQFLRITEINYQPHAPNPLPGLDEIDDGTPTAADRFEFVEMTNTGDETLDLSGVQFTAGIDFTFPAGTALEPGRFVVVAKDRAALESRYGTGLNVAGEFTGTLADQGETIFLDTASSRAIQSFAFRSDAPWPQRAAGRGSSLETTEVGGSLDAPESWRASTEFGGSPGRAGIDPSAPVVISEVLANSGSPDGDMIELHNQTGTPIDVSNWYLSNSDEDYFRFRVAPGTTIEASGYAAWGQLGFDLDRARGDDVWLIASDPQGKPQRFVDHIQFGPSAQGVSLGPWPTSIDEWIMLAEPTFGGPNADPYVGDVAISEVYYQPLDLDGGGRLEPDDFEYLELFNRTDTPIDIGDWQLAGSAQFVFPAGTVIDAQDALTVVAFDPSDAAAANVFRFTLGIDASANLVGPFTPPLDDAGGTVQLVRPDAPPEGDPTFTPLILVDEISYAPDLPWPTSAAGSGDSLARVQPTDYGNSPASWIGANPTPGEASFISRRPGDANEDGQFNQLDLVAVLQAGKFMTGEPAVWSEGDWNGDGVFDPLDLVAALQADDSLPPAAQSPVSPRPGDGDWPTAAGK